MRLVRPSRREGPETIVALVDVVFFMLVFFLLTARMDATAPFEVAPPEAATGSDMPGGGLTLSVGEEGSLAMNGEILDRNEALARVAAAVSERQGITVRINAHRAARLRDVLPLAGEAEALGAGEVVLVVTPPG